MPPLFYACTAETKRKGRCQNDAQVEGRCLDHPTAPRASQPDMIQVELHVNLEQSQGLELGGIPRRGIYEGIPPKSTQVFGAYGLARVQISHAVQEMRENGYGAEEPSLLQRDETMDILVLPFSRTSSSRDIPAGVEQFLCVTWGYCKVLVAPNSEDGRVIHIVNCAHKLSFPPLYELSFEEGLWGVKEPSETRP